MEECYQNYMEYLKELVETNNILADENYLPVTESLSTYSQGLEKINDIRSVAFLQKKIHEFETDDITHKLSKHKADIQLSLEEGCKIIDNLSNGLEFVVKNKHAIENLLNEPVEIDSLPVPILLHKKIEKLFKNISYICNHFEYISKNVEKVNAVKLDQVLLRLSEAVHKHEHDALNEAIQDIEACCNFMKMKTSREL